MNSSCLFKWSDRRETCFIKRVLAMGQASYKNMLGPQDCLNVRRLKLAIFFC